MGLIGAPILIEYDFKHTCCWFKSHNRSFLMKREPLFMETFKPIRELGSAVYVLRGEAHTDISVVVRAGKAACYE